MNTPQNLDHLFGRKLGAPIIVKLPEGEKKEAKPVAPPVVPIEHA